MFVKALQVQLPNGQVFSDEHIFMLEEKFSHTEKDLEFDLSDNSILLYDTSLIWQENISFSHYMKEGKILKSFLIEIGLATEENYKGYFLL